MAELVANGADSIDDAIRLIAIELGGAGIAVGIYAVERLHYRPCVRPHIALVISAKVRAVSGEDDVEHIHIAIVVAIILAVIDQ